MLLNGKEFGILDRENAEYEKSGKFFDDKRFTERYSNCLEAVIEVSNETNPPLAQIFIDDTDLIRNSKNLNQIHFLNRLQNGQ